MLTPFTLQCGRREQLQLGQSVQQALLGMVTSFTHMPAGLACLGAQLAVNGCMYTEAQDAAVLQAVKARQPAGTLEVCPVFSVQVAP